MEAQRHEWQKAPLVPSRVHFKSNYATLEKCVVWCVHQKTRRTNVNGFYEDGHTSARHSAHARFGSSGKANSPNRRKEGERLGDISAEDAVGFAKGRGMSFSDSSRCVCRCWMMRQRRVHRNNALMLLIWWQWNPRHRWRTTADIRRKAAVLLIAQNVLVNVLSSSNR